MMLESICTNCGNKKLFEESNIGRTYKCPNCQLPVKIVQSTVEANSIQREFDDSLSEEILKAKTANEMNEMDDEMRIKRDQTTDKYVGFILIVVGVSLFVSYTFLGILSLIGAFFFLRRSKAI